MWIGYAIDHELCGTVWNDFVEELRAGKLGMGDQSFMPKAKRMTEWGGELNFHPNFNLTHSKNKILECKNNHGSCEWKQSDVDNSRKIKVLRSRDTQYPVYRSSHSYSREVLCWYNETFHIRRHAETSETSLSGRKWREKQIYTESRKGTIWPTDKKTDWIATESRQNESPTQDP